MVKLPGGWVRAPQVKLKCGICKGRKKITVKEKSHIDGKRRSARVNCWNCGGKGYTQRIY